MLLVTFSISFFSRQNKGGIIIHNRNLCGLWGIYVPHALCPKKSPNQFYHTMISCTVIKSPIWPFLYVLYRLRSPNTTHITIIYNSNSVSIWSIYHFLHSPQSRVCHSPFCKCHCMSAVGSTLLPKTITYPHFSTTRILVLKGSFGCGFNR